ncbi:hypothetical protein ALT1000_300005 [Alteromonas macleodii]
MGSIQPYVLFKLIVRCAHFRLDNVFQQLTFDNVVQYHY